MTERSPRSEVGILPLFDGITEKEARALLRVVLSNGDFPDVDFTDQINLAISVCLRVANQMLERGDEGFSERTKSSIAARKAQGWLL